jgi:hypothetical protein
VDNNDNRLCQVVSAIGNVVKANDKAILVDRGHTRLWKGLLGRQMVMAWIDSNRFMVRPINVESSRRGRRALADQELSNEMHLSVIIFQKSSGHLEQERWDI